MAADAIVEIAGKTLPLVFTHKPRCFLLFNLVQSGTPCSMSEILPAAASDPIP
jgi:hypothetical protein